MRVSTHSKRSQTELQKPLASSHFQSPSVTSSSSRVHEAKPGHGSIDEQLTSSPASHRRYQLSGTDTRRRVDVKYLSSLQTDRILSDVIEPGREELRYNTYVPGQTPPHPTSRMSSTVKSKSEDSLLTSSSDSQHSEYQRPRGPQEHQTKSDSPSQHLSHSSSHTSSVFKHYTDDSLLSDSSHTQPASLSVSQRQRSVHSQQRQSSASTWPTPHHPNNSISETEIEKDSAKSRRQPDSRNQPPALSVSQRQRSTHSQQPASATSTWQTPHPPDDPLPEIERENFTTRDLSPDKDSVRTGKTRLLQQPDGSTQTAQQIKTGSNEADSQSSQEQDGVERASEQQNPQPPKGQTIQGLQPATAELCAPVSAASPRAGLHGTQSSSDDDSSVYHSAPLEDDDMLSTQAVSNMQLNCN